MRKLTLVNYNDTSAPTWKMPTSVLAARHNSQELEMMTKLHRNSEFLVVFEGRKRLTVVEDE